MSMAKKQKSQLARVMADEKASIRKKYYPNYAELEKWWRAINREIFNGELHTPLFEIRRRRMIFGECIGESLEDLTKVTLSFDTWFYSRKHFIEVIIHEMVHQWEWQTHGTMGHGKLFYQWSPALAKYGMKLTECQE